MPRVKRGTHRRDRRKKMLGLTKAIILKRANSTSSPKKRLTAPGDFLIVTAAYASASFGACGLSASEPQPV